MSKTLNVKTWAVLLLAGLVSSGTAYAASSVSELEVPQAKQQATGNCIGYQPVMVTWNGEPIHVVMRRERAVELINENFRMDDLKRWNAMTLLDNPLTMLGIAVTPESESDTEPRMVNHQVKMDVGKYG